MLLVSLVAACVFRGQGARPKVTSSTDPKYSYLPIDNLDFAKGSLSSFIDVTFNISNWPTDGSNPDLSQMANPQFFVRDDSILGDPQAAWIAIPSANIFGPIYDSYDRVVEYTISLPTGITSGYMWVQMTGYPLKNDGTPDNTRPLEQGFMAASFPNSTQGQVQAQVPPTRPGTVVPITLMRPYVGGWSTRVKHTKDTIKIASKFNNQGRWGRSDFSKPRTYTLDDSGGHKPEPGQPWAYTASTTTDPAANDVRASVEFDGPDSGWYMVICKEMYATNPSKTQYLYRSGVIRKIP